MCIPENWRSYILKTKNQQITIQVDNYRPPKITPNDGPGPVSAHAPTKDMEREKARNVVPPAPSPAPFPEGGIPSPFPEGNEPAPVMESKAADPFPEEAAPPDFTNLKPKSADEVALPSIQDVAQGSLFEEPKKPEAEKAKVFQSNPINEEYTFETFVHGGCNDVAYSGGPGRRTGCGQSKADGYKYESALHLRPIRPWQDASSACDLQLHP